jgi:hypothetical protein
MATTEGRTILIGSKISDHIEITSISEKLQGDRKIIYATVHVVSKPWIGEWTTEFVGIELKEFARDIQGLYEKLDTTIKYDSWEGDLSLVFQGDGRGHIEISGTTHNVSTYESAVQVRFQMDQTQLPALVKLIREFVAD